MSDIPNSLSLRTLRFANLARLPDFRNAKGEPAHSEPDGSDWSLNDWMTAVCGELGEAANILKKVRRGDVTLDQARPALANEYADVVLYLDILAYQTGVDLELAVTEKFNEVSKRIGTTVFIGSWKGKENENNMAGDSHDGSHHLSALPEKVELE